MKYDVTNPGAGIYFDGLTARRHAVEVSLAEAGVRISGEQIYLRWPYDELEHLSAPEGVLRLGRIGAQTLERLEIRDPDLAHAIDERSKPVDRSGKAERRMRARVLVWSMAAVAALVLMAIYGVPALAERLTPFIPVRFEAWMGEAVDAQVRAMLDTKGAGKAFECGGHPGEQAGLAALEKIRRTDCRQCNRRRQSRVGPRRHPRGADALRKIDQKGETSRRNHRAFVRVALPLPGGGRHLADARRRLYAREPFEGSARSL